MTMSSPFLGKLGALAALFLPALSACGDDSTGRPSGGIKAIGADHRVCIKMGVTAFRHHRVQGFKITLFMHTQKLMLGHFWSIDIPEHIEETGCNQPIFYGCKTPCVLRVTFTGVMFVTYRVTDIGCTQVRFPVWYLTTLSCLKLHHNNSNCCRLS